MTDFDPEATAKRIHARRQYIEALKKQKEVADKNLQDSVEGIDRYLKD